MSFLTDRLQQLFPTRDEQTNQGEQQLPPSRDYPVWDPRSKAGEVQLGQRQQEKKRSNRFLQAFTPKEQAKAAFQSGTKLLQVGYEQFERHVQEPLLGLAYRSPLIPPVGEFRERQQEMNNIYDAVRDEGEDWWHSYGRSFAEAKTIPTWEKIVSKVVVDPLNLVGWGLLGKLPWHLSKLGAIDSAFLWASNVPFKAGANVARAADAAMEAHHIVPPSVVRLRYASKAYSDTWGSFNRAVKLATGETMDVAGVDTGRKLATVLRAPIKNLNKTREWVRDLKFSVADASVPKIDQVINARPIVQAIEAGARPEFLYDQVYQVMANHLAGATKYTRGFTIDRLTSIGGGTRDAATWATKFLDDATKFQDEVVQSISSQSVAKSGANVARLAGERAAAAKEVAYIGGMNGVMSSTMKKLDWAETTVLRGGIDKWLTKPFAEANLGFPMYYAMNAIEETLRSVLGHAKPMSLTNTEFSRITGHLRATPVGLQEVRGGGAVAAALPGEALSTSRLSLQETQKVFKSLYPAGEGKVDLDLIRNLGESVAKSKGMSAEKITASGREAIDLAKRGKLELDVPFYGKIKIGRREDTPYFEWGISKGPTGGYTFLPKGTVGQWLGRKYIDMSLHLADLRRGFYYQRFMKEYQTLTGDMPELRELRNVIFAKAPKSVLKVPELRDAQYNFLVAAESGQDLKKVAKTFNAAGINKNRVKSLLARTPNLSPTSRAVLRDAINTGNFDQLAKAVGSLEKLELINLLHHPVVMADGMKQASQALRNTEFTRENAHEVLNMFNGVMDASFLYPHEISRAAGELAQQFTDPTEINALWRSADAQMRQFEDEIFPVTGQIMDDLRFKANKIGMEIGHFTDEWAKMVETTRSTIIDLETWKATFFAQKTKRGDAFWAEYRAHVNKTWSDHQTRMAGHSGDLWASLNQGGSRLARVKIQPLEANGDLKIEQVAQIFGGTGDDLSKAVVENLAFMREESFVAFVTRYIERSGIKHIGVTDAKLKKLHRLLVDEHLPGTVTGGRGMSMMSQRTAEIADLSANLKTARVAPAVNDDIMADFNQWVDDIVAAQEKTLGPKGAGPTIYHGSPTAGLTELKTSASGDWGTGVYFTTKRGSALDDYSRGRKGLAEYVVGDTATLPPKGTIYAFKSPLKNPLKLTSAEDHNQWLARAGEEFGEETEQNLAKLARREGYDGIVDDVLGEGIVFDKNVPLQDLPQQNPTMAQAVSKQEQAAEIAAGQLKREFVDYDDPLYIDMFMRHFFPYWQYESRRWPWLFQHGIQYPAMGMRMGQYYNNTDHGYLSTFGDVMFSPLRGSIYGITATLTRQDYKEAYEGMPYEAADFIGRRGFFPGFPYQFALNTMGAVSEGHLEYGEMLPPLPDSILNVGEALGIPGAIALRELVVPTRFLHYQQDVKMESMFGTRKGDAEREIKALEGIAEKDSIQTARLEELQGQLNAAKRSVARFSIVDNMMGMLRLYPKERLEAKKLRPQILADFLKIPLKEVEDMEFWGKNPLDLYNDRLTPGQRKLLFQLEVYRWAGIGQELQTYEPMSTLKRRQEEYDEELSEVINGFYNGAANIDLEFTTRQKWDRAGRAAELKRMKDARASQMEALDKKYKWQFKDGEYLGGIPLTTDEYRQYAEWTGRIDIAPPHILTELRDTYFRLDPNDYTFAGGDIDWDTYNNRLSAVEDAVPEIYKEEWEWTMQGTLPPLSQLERQTRSTVLQEYWDLSAQTLDKMLPQEQATVLYVQHGLDDELVQRYKDTEAWKGYQKVLRNRRTVLRRINPEVDYYLWLFGYTDNGVDGADTPFLFKEWGYTPPSLPDPATWAMTREERTTERLTELAEIYGLEDTVEKAGGIREGG